MSQGINCEAFQIRAGTNRLTTDRGLAVTEKDGKLFIDPQIESKYWTSLGPMKPEDLRLQLSDSNPPEISQESIAKVYSFSVNAMMLNGLKKRSTELRRFRIQAPNINVTGRAALIGIVNHDTAANPFGYVITDEESVFLDLAHTGDELYDPVVAMTLVPEGRSMYIHHNIGFYNRIIKTFAVSYDPDSESGLTVKKLDGPTENPSQPPPTDLSGDREPRNPLPSAPSALVNFS